MLQQKFMTMLSSATIKIAEYEALLEEHPNLKEDPTIQIQLKKLEAMKKYATSRKKVASTVFSSNNTGGGDKEKEGPGEIPYFLTEVGIKNTKPIIILTFKKFLAITLRYLAALNGHVLRIGEKAHKKDVINVDTAKRLIAMYYLRTSDEATDPSANLDQTNLPKNSGFAAKERIHDIIMAQLNGLQTDDEGNIKLTIFCDELAKAVTACSVEFEKQPKEVRRELGKKFRKFTKVPYPSLADMTNAIEIATTRFDVEADAKRIAKLLAELEAGYQDIKKVLETLKSEHAEDYLRVSPFEIDFKKYKESVLKTLNPGTEDEDGVVSSPIEFIVGAFFDDPLGRIKDLERIEYTTDLVYVKDAVDEALLALDEFKASVKEGIESSTILKVTDINGFFGITALKFIKTFEPHIVVSKLDIYQGQVSEWFAMFDELASQLSHDEEWNKYYYKTPMIINGINNLLTNSSNHLIDFKATRDDIAVALNTGKSYIGLDEVAKVLDNHFRYSVLEKKVNYPKKYLPTLENNSTIHLYKDVNGNLPTSSDIETAFKDARLNMELNRAMEFALLQGEIRFAPLQNVLGEGILGILDTVQLPQLVGQLRQAINDGLTPGTNAGWIESLILWFIRQAIDLGMSAIEAITDFVDQGLRTALQNLPQSRVDPSNYQFNLPLILQVENDKSGKPFAYATVKDGIGESVVFSCDQDTSIYEISITAFTSHVTEIKHHTVTTSVRFNFSIERKPVSSGFSISPPVLGVDASFEIAGEKDDFRFEMDLVSTYSGNKVSTSWSNLSWTRPGQLAGDAINQINNPGVTNTPSFKAFNF